jgi:hypothetical protein
MLVHQVVAGGSQAEHDGVAKSVSEAFQLGGGQPGGVIGNQSAAGTEMSGQNQVMARRRALPS